MSKDRASAVKFDLEEEKLTVSSSSPDLGEAKEEVAVDYKGDKVSLGFNATVCAGCSWCDDIGKGDLELQDPLSPVLVKEEGNEDYKCVIMPMRI